MRRMVLILAGALIATACTTQRQVETIPGCSLPVATPIRALQKDDALAANKQQIRNMVYFLYDSDEITSQGKDVLLAKAKALAELPEETLIIEGHCDERGENAYNRLLGNRRAQAVHDFMLQHGVQGPRLLCCELR